MTASPPHHPLSSLLGPLRYACERDFARLSLVKGLRPLLEGAIAQSRELGVSKDVLKSLSNELDGVDSPSLPVRKASLSRVLSVLQTAGVAASKDGGAPRPGSQNETGAQAQEATPNVAKPKGARAVRKKAALGRAGKPTAEEEQARLLSIAPREGPLAKLLKDVGQKQNPRLLSLLYKKGIRRVGDVLFMLPRTYEDRRTLRKIAQLVPGERGVTVGVVKTAGDGAFRAGRRTFRAVVADETGSIAATYFQSGPWLKARFPLGRRVVLSGEVRASSFGREIPHPDVEPADDLEQSSVHFQRVVPVYSGFERHEQRAVRDLTWRVGQEYVTAIEDPLPVALRHRLGLLALSEAIRRIHFPLPGDDLDALSAHTSMAHQRLAFDELFFLQLGMALKRQGVKSEEGVAFNVSPERMLKAKGVLPFALTQAQERVVRQISQDLARKEPMNRLVQGDVGSGKTAVALIAAALALQDGYQVGLMAPTEILAEQHAKTFTRLLAPLGVKVGLFTSSGTPQKRRELREAAARGDIGMAVGTHALIQSEVEFYRLGLVVIDEQHRFGVMQRQTLMAKGARPDVLVMTATPIPRTLAMTLYGDLDVSVIDELPPGRTPITTRVFPDKARARVYASIREQLDKGHQAYVVYPLVEESEKLDLADATQGADQLRAVFPEHRIGLLHGRMKPDEKEAIMEAFRAHQLDLLVSTTVIEVGVDVPNASVMVIEAAERFGLSQLHQLRGRVGRGAAVSYCFLVAGHARSKESSERLAVMERSNDGFVIAEKDLELRGPGEFLGTRQSGMPELAVANLARDQALLSEARECARSILEQDPGLKRPEHQRLVRALEDRWEGRLSLARVG